MNDQDRLRFHLPLYRLMNGPRDEFLWDKLCVSPPAGDQQSEMGAYIAMYLTPDGDSVFVHNCVGGTVEQSMFALAVTTLQLPDWAAATMRERDDALAEPGDVRFDDEAYAEATLLGVVTLLPQDDPDNRLPAAYASLSSIFGGHRTHLDFYVHKKLPARILWNTFRANVATGLIGL